LNAAHRDDVKRRPDVKRSGVLIEWTTASTISRASSSSRLASLDLHGFAQWEGDNPPHSIDQVLD
jgi:hypothetical protein